MSKTANAFAGYVPQINWAATFPKPHNPTGTPRASGVGKLHPLPSGSINTEKTLARDKSAKLRGKL